MHNLVGLKHVIADESNSSGPILAVDILPAELIKVCLCSFITKEKNICTLENSSLLVTRGTTRSFWHIRAARGVSEGKTQRLDFQ